MTSFHWRLGRRSACVCVCGSVCEGAAGRKETPRSGTILSVLVLALMCVSVSVTHDGMIFQVKDNQLVCQCDRLVHVFLYSH